MFLISLVAFIFGSLMCWINEHRRMVLICWGLWLVGFFAIPMIFGQGWPFLVLQSLLALSLVFKWKVSDALP